MSNTTIKNQNKIDRFKDEYFFLSNFYRVPVIYMGITYQSSEAAFQAAKCPSKAHLFTVLSPSEAKKFGRTVPIRGDWEEIKDTVMRDVCLAKFSQNRDIMLKLLSTGDAVLEEGNTWGDTYWGIVNGVGMNKLGKILMSIREEFKKYLQE